MIVDVADVRRGTVLPAGKIALFDPIGGPIAVALAEDLGDRAILITQDHIAGNELSRTGDLAPANVRLAQRGVDHRTTDAAARRPSRAGRGRGSLLGPAPIDHLCGAGRLWLPPADGRARRRRSLRR